MFLHQILLKISFEPLSLDQILVNDGDYGCKLYDFRNQDIIALPGNFFAATFVVVGGGVGERDE